ncbi:MAG: helix-turn-helix domain-containing protein [Prevotella sp.]|nr:helix-turn-helix domain-containing protein [Prevotella sp.]
MKDRIRQIMEAQHMTQQVFAEYIGSNAATLSGIFNDRTRPTLNIVEAIKKKIPDINLEWLLFGQGSMYSQKNDANSAASGNSVQSEPDLFGHSNQVSPIDQLPDFSSQPSPTPFSGGQQQQSHYSVRNTRAEYPREDLKIFDKQQRRVTEIRVYYDDQTWESFVPSKK